MKKRILSGLLAIIMFISIIPINANAITFTQLNANNVFLKQAGATTCTLCATTMMMRRYSMLRGDAGWNTITEAAIKPTAWISGEGLRWSFSYSNSVVGNISVGHYTLPGGTANDALIQAELKKCPEGIVIYNESVPHAVLLTDYTNGTYYCADPLGSIASGRIPLTSAYKVRLNNVTAYWKVTSPIVDGPDNSDEPHYHSYSGSYHDSAHPHKIYEKCSCGAKNYTGKNQTVSSCSQCSFKQDSKYDAVKGFKAYPCVSSDFEVKKSDLTTRNGEIYTTDYCTIEELYTNGWCKVTFPLDSGGTRTAYTKIDKFIKTPSASLTKYTATSYINLYATSSMSKQLYRIYPGDVCYTIGTSGSATQIFMPKTGENYYVLGWAYLPSAPETSGYDVPFKCRTISTDKVVCYNDIGFSSVPGKIYPEDDCVIENVYSNGKVQVTCPWSDGTKKTVYVNKSVFINSNSTPVNTTAPKYAKTYLRTDMKTNIGWIDAGDPIQIVATSGDKTQIIYPADVGKRCAWVYTSDLTKNYTVSYNANGGSGAPASQIKTHGKDLKLSSSIPTKTGHTFVGWSTDSSATTAQYSAGSIYTNDKAVTLYAVWRKQTFTITYDANGGINAPGIQMQTYQTAITVTNEKPDKKYTVTYNANGGEISNNSYVLDCSFDSWNTKADGTGTVVKSGSPYTPNANVTLYAQYKNPTLGDYPLPIRTGYTFNGWYTSQSGGNKADRSTVITANTTLYAHWDLETYSVIYFDDGSSNIPAEQTKTYGTDITLSSEFPEKEGFIFKGWATEEGSSEVVYAPGDKYTENDWLILYAVWEKEAATLSGIKIEQEPTKVIYELGDSFDETGIVISALYSDGTKETLTNGYTLSGFDSETVGTKLITVSYGGYETEFTITVLEKGFIIQNAPTVVVASADCNSGDQVDVAISIKNNPGITSMLLKVNYDSELMELVDVVDCEILGSAYHSDNYKSPYVLCWANDTLTSNIKDNGEIVVLTFKVSADIKEAVTCPITVTYDVYNFDIIDKDMNPVVFEIENGEINIAVKDEPEDETYVICFNGNGVELNYPEVEIQYEDILRFSDVTNPTREGYNFVRWSFSPAGDSDYDTLLKVANGVSPAIMKLLGNVDFKEITLYAIWEEDASLTECEKNGHTEEILPAVAPTCTATGLTEGKKCSVCGEILVAQTEVAATGHTLVAIPGKPTTETETGLTDGEKCSVCGKVTKEQEEIPVIEKHTHNYVKVVTAPTCTSQGYTTFTCSCGDSYVGEYVGYAEHKETVIPAKAPTCTSSGLTEGVKCSVCNKILVEQRIVSALGHNEVSIPGKSATCTSSGLTEGKKCSVCNETLVAQKTIAALGHNPGKWEVVKVAEIGKEGKEQQKCQVCNAVINERTIPALKADVYTPGDIDDNGKITAADARLVLRASAKLETLSENQKLAADVSKDKKITAADARTILRVSAKLESF